MQKATMILEGGATRGVFTSGALDYLMEQDCYMSHVVGVSAGACNGIDYVSKQIGRSRDCIIHKEKEYNFVNLRKFIKEKNIFDMDMIFDHFPNRIFPFDYETYFSSAMTSEIVTTNCVTGRAEYMQEQEDKARLMKLCRASSSMPLVSQIVLVDGKPYLDGGLGDSLPIRRAMQIGNRKIVMILTRNPKYRKKQPGKGSRAMYLSAYKKYPNLVRSILSRADRYNKTMDYIEYLEQEKKIFVIRPQVKTVGRLEQNYDVLMRFYQHGYDEMKEQFNGLQRYLSCE